MCGSGVFETPQRLHPLTLVHRLFVRLPYIALLLVPLVANPGMEQWAGVSLAVMVGVVTVPWIILSYLRFSYQITEQEVLIDSGVLSRRHRSIPVDRIQNVEIKQTLLQRAMGLAGVRLETAGGAHTEGLLHFVSPETADRIRQVIRARQASSDTADGTIVPEPEPGSGEPVVLPAGEILLAGALRFSLVYIAIIFTGLQYVNIQPEEVAEWLAGPGFERFVDEHRLSWAVVFVSGVLVAALLAWIAGVVTTFNRYYGYRVWLESGKMQRKHGLFSTLQGTVPLKHIQMLRYRTNPPLRLLGRSELHLQTMGVDPSQTGSQVALPIARVDTCRTLAGKLLPGTGLPETYDRVSPLHIRRLFARQTMGLLVVTAVASVWLPAGVWWLLTLTPLFYFIAMARYRVHGYALAENALVIRIGLLQRTVEIVPYDRVQVLRTTASLFQRRLGLRSVQVDVAGGVRLQSQTIVDLTADTADNLIDELYGRFSRASDLRRAGGDLRSGRSFHPQQESP